MANKIEVLEHEILGTLIRIGLRVTARGSDVDGHVPLDVRLVETSVLQYGTLVALLNDPNFKPKDGQPTFLNQVKTTQEEIGTDLKYDWNEIVIALEILEANGDVIEERVGIGLEISDRKIRLAPKGLKSYNTKSYIKEVLKEREAEYLAQSTLQTNRFVRITSVLAVVFSILAAFISYMQYVKKDEISNADFHELINEVHQLKQNVPTGTPKINKDNSSK